METGIGDWPRREAGRARFYLFVARTRNAGVRDGLRSLAAASPIRYHAAMSDLRFADPFGARCRGDAHAARRAR
jgi:hypothetical protein